MILTERKSSEPAVEKVSKETSKKDEEPLPASQVLNRDGSGQSPAERPLYVETALTGRPSSAQVKENISPEPPPLPATGSSAKSSTPPQAGKAPTHARAGQMSVERASREKAITSSTPTAPQHEKLLAEFKPPLNKSREESEIKQAPLPVPLANQKEEVSSKSIGVQQEGTKDSILTADVLNQFNLGIQFYSQRDFSKAIQSYQKVIELDPTYAEAYNNLGIVYQMIGDFDRAFWAYQKSTEINPRYEKGYNNLGILFFLKGRYEEALGSFQKALAVNPNNIESHINLGILFKRKGESGKAIESYQKALLIDPFHKETHYNIALLHEQLEDLDLAISHYQQFIQLSSKSHPELVLRVQRHLNELTKIKRK
jgi:type IV pilus biogenesis/stability protein PilW